MKYSARVIYAAVRAEVLAYRPRLERAVLEAIRLAQRNARRIHYAKQPFDESKHPRAPAGRPEGGEFVHAGGEVASSAPAKQTDVVRKAPQSWAAKYRDAFNELSTRSTAELQASLKFHTDFLVDRFPSDLRASHRIWVDRIQELLAERDYSDQNAPLAAKERIWAAQKKYLPLAVERVRLEKWLASAKRRIYSKDLLRNIREVQDALQLIKTQMEKLALITGARLPQNNPIRDWSFEQKFSRAAEIALQSGKLAPEVAAELRAAIQPANLVRMGAMMAALAAAHAYPLAGFAADAVLLTYVGVDGALTGHRLYLEISSIQNEADLNAAADVLRKELASQASGKLIDVLTWGTGKGVGAFNKRYKVTIDHNQVRRLSTGEMPLIPNPKNLPVKVDQRTKTTQRGLEDAPSAKNVHDRFVQKVRPGATERVFETPWSIGKGLGSRKFDDFDKATLTGFEGNTTPWSRMTQEQLSRKLDQVGSDFVLLKTDTNIKRIVWFGTEPLPTRGLGAKLRQALQEAGIEYWVVKP
ncbi:MAG: hypothetical protein JWP89_6149 [Schlesneria sp.]|nr:hypothetical protein [Schlesneria sp.]